MRGEVNKIIEDKSQSPWVSPVILVRKKDGTIRFCVDYRRLNAITIKDSYPLLRIDGILDQLSGNSWSSTLDLTNGISKSKSAKEIKRKPHFRLEMACGNLMLYHSVCVTPLPLSKD